MRGERLEGKRCTISLALGDPAEAKDARREAGGKAGRLQVAGAKVMR